MKKRCMVVTILFASLLCVPLSIFGNGKSKPRPRPASPPCVQCGFNASNCRTCVGGGGALYCETFNCGACEETGSCSDGSGGDGIGTAARQNTADSKQPLSKEPLRIPSSVIRDIGEKHARFAITLAEMSVYGISPSDRRVRWTPVRLSSSDVEAFLNKETHSRFFRRYDKEVRRLNALIQEGELSDIVYAVSIKQAEEGSWSIRMQVEGELAVASGDPAYSTLEIQVRTPQDVQANVAQQPSRKKVTWHIQ